MADDNDKQLFTPAEAADYLTKHCGRKITVARLAQLRRAGKVKANPLGYNATVYMRADLNEAVGSLKRPNDNTDEDGTIAA